MEKIIFFRDWVLLGLGIITLSYLLSLIVVLLVHGAFGFSMMEWGTPLSQTLMQMAGGAVIGLGTGIYQRFLLKKRFDVKPGWIYTLISGFVVVEMVTGMVLWRMGLNRGELRFIEFNPLPESLIFAVIGLVTGFLQWILLRKFFFRAGYWIFASGLGWWICIAMTYVFTFIGREASLYGFPAGTLFYGAITGTTLIWILKRR